MTTLVSIGSVSLVARWADAGAARKTAAATERIRMIRTTLSIRSIAPGDRTGLEIRATTARSPPSRTPARPTARRASVAVAEPAGASSLAGPTNAEGTVREGGLRVVVARVSNPVLPTRCFQPVFQPGGSSALPHYFARLMFAYS